MAASTTLLQFLLMVVAGWLQRQQAAVIEYPDATRLEEFDAGSWGEKYPAIAQSWRRNWKQVIPFFAFPASRPPDHLHHQCDREFAQRSTQSGARTRSFPE
jgi:Transposase, Mutator family